MAVQADEACACGGKTGNGFRERELVTTVGAFKLHIPKLRSMGSYLPEGVLDRHSRTDSRSPPCP